MNFKLFILTNIFLFIYFGNVIKAQDLPLKEHEMLKMDDGIWEAKIKILSGSDGKVIESTAKETNYMIGDLWSVGKLEGNIAGTDFEGFATLGYDPIQKKYVGTWVDSTSPVISQMEGDYNEKTKTLTLFYTTYSKKGKPEERKNIMIYKNKNTRDFTMYLKSGSDWIESMKILYKKFK